MLNFYAVHKRVRKKTISILAAVTLPFALAACGGGSDGDGASNSASTSTFSSRDATQATAVATASKSTKRGIAYGGNSAADLTALSKGISWWYNWSPAPETGAASVYKSLGVDFAPMVWGGTPNADQLALSIPDGSKYLLTFNEPNFKSQANKTPTQAAALWPVIEDVARRKNLQISSPAVNYCGDCVSEGGVTFTDPVVYLDAFFAACATCKVDFIAVHWYACDVSALQWYIERFKKYNKPIWLTEFACGDKPHDQITLDVQKNYMTAAVNYLENDPAVARYSWFSGRNNEIPNINLLGADGKLTDLGQLYVSLPSASTNASEVELTPLKAVASGVENSTLGPEKAIDKNLTTRWSSAFNDQQWIYLDFGATKNISHVKINWENAYGKDYQIQTSNDAVTWTTIKSVTGSDGGIDDLTGLTGGGRYLRMNGIHRSSPYGYSIFEITTWGPSTASTQTQLTPVKAIASGVENATLGPEKAIDNNLNTRWSSAFNDQQWIYLDFGAKANFSRVKINWENAHATDYQLQVSNDTVTWTTIKSISGSLGSIEDMAISGSGRYLRMNGIHRSTPYGYSMFEIAVWGTLTSVASP